MFYKISHKYGGVSRVVMHRKIEEDLLSAFVEFFDVGSARKAIHGLDGRRIFEDGCEIRTDFARCEVFLSVSDFRSLNH